MILWIFAQTKYSEYWTFNKFEQKDHWDIQRTTYIRYIRLHTGSLYTAAHLVL